MVGDRLLATASPTAGRELGLVEWALLEAEAGTLGAVQLSVERAGRRLELELAPSPWEVQVVPPLPPALRDSVAALPNPQALASVKAAAATAPPATATWLYLEIARSTNKGDPAQAEALERAIAVAAEAAGRSGSPLIEGWAWWQRGLIQWRANDHASARNAFDRAAELLADRPLAQAAVLIRRGISGFNSSSQQEAQADLERAAALIREVTDTSTSLAQALNLIAQCQRNRHEFEPAQQNLTQAEAILTSLAPAHPNAAQLQFQFGKLAVARGDLALAARYYETAASSYREAGVVSRDVGNTLMGISSLASVRGDLEGAETKVRQALEIFEHEAAGSPHHIWALRTLGSIHLRRGQPATAQALFGQALELASGLDGGTGASTGEVLWNLAELAEKQGRADLAVERYHQALAIFEESYPDSPVVGNLRTELGRARLNRGDLEGARDPLEASLQQFHELAPGGLWEGWTLYQLGRLASEEGRATQALALLRSARAIFHRWAPDTVAEAEILHTIGHVQRKMDLPDEAMDSFEAAVGALERQLPRLGSPEVGAAERARHGALYDEYLDLLIEHGLADRAFQLLERSRARALLALLAERDLVYRSALPDPLDRERRAARAAHAQALEELSTLSSQSPPEVVAAATRQLRLARERQQQVRLEIRRQSPRLAGLSDPEPMDWPSAAAALDPGTLALVFHAGTDQMVLFALSRDAELAVTTVPIGAEALAEKVRRYRLLLRNPASDEGLTRRGRELSQLLLSPFAAQIANAERLLIVPDGPLHLLPFGALPAAQGDGRLSYLAAQHPLHFTASLALFAELSSRGREEAQERSAATTRAGATPATPPRATLVAFGDPRLDAKTIALLPGSQADGLQQLALAGDEVRSIAGLFSGRTEVFTGLAATEARAKQVDPQTRYLHFATHGVLDERLPLNSALVLARSEGATGEDGLFQAWEIIEELTLGCELVTLSSCESALGSELAGEGLIGLTRAFQYAGARSVLASLWSVSDRSTAHLMHLFYQGLRDGRTKDEALRRAQLALLQETRLQETRPAPRSGLWARLPHLFRSAPEPSPALDASHPYYWAAFQLYGDWR
jgi:CHAT domain-containing protein/Tfp pilus assembly protein PilF